MSSISKKMQMATAGVDTGSSIFTYTISGTFTSQINIGSSLVASGWDQSSEVLVILDGCIIFPSSEVIPIYISGYSYPNGLTIQVNSGTVLMGRGGRGRNNTSGESGSSAIFTDTDLTINLDSSNLTTSPNSAHIYGGGGGGGGAYFRRSYASGKSTAYRYQYCAGGGGAGGGSNSAVSGPSAINLNGINYPDTGVDSSVVLSSPSNSSNFPCGYGACFIHANPSPTFTYNANIYGTTGGTYVNIDSRTNAFTNLLHPYGIAYGYVRLGLASNVASPTDPVIGTGSYTNVGAYVASGHGGGYGANGGSSAGYENYSSSSLGVYSFSGGLGGAAIQKASGTEVITFTGDISPSSADNAVCRFLGSYT